MIMDFSTIPLIIEHSLIDGELHLLLKSKHFKIRASSNIPYHSCVFPLSGVACIIENFTDIIGPNSNITEDFKQRLARLLSQLHYQHYIFLMAPILGLQELHALKILQNKYITTALQFLPVHNITECFSSLLSIIQVTFKPVKETVKERYKKEIDKMVSEEAIISALKIVGLTEHEATVTIDGCGSLQSLAQHNVQSLSDCTSLDYRSAQLLHNFLSKK